MKTDYKIPLQVVVNSLRHYQQIEAGVEETDGLDFFPNNAVETCGDDSSYTLRFNPKVQTLLALYNPALGKGMDTGEAIIRYSLFHAALEVDDYGQARAHLDAFHSELNRLPLSARSEEEREEANAQVLVQLYFLLYHEAFHLILHHHPDIRPVAFDTTRQLLLNIKKEWEDGFSLVTEEELLNHPKTQRHINNMIPTELSETERQMLKECIRGTMSECKSRFDYIDQVLQGDKTQMEEITCDRNAWLNLLPLFQDKGATEQELLQIHLWIFAVFNAMDFNKFLLSQYVPSLHGKTEYDGMRVVLRHKAFTALLQQYNPEVYKLLKSEYVDLSYGLEAICRSAFMAWHHHADDLSRLYAKYQESGGSHPDFAQIQRLEQELAEAVSVLP